MARLDYRHAVRQRLQHIQPLGLTIYRRHGKDVQTLQEADLGDMIGGRDVLDMSG